MFFFNSAIFVVSFANNVMKVQPRKFVRSLHRVPRTLQYVVRVIPGNLKNLKALVNFDVVG